MMKKWKWIALLMALVLAVSTGCASSGPTTTIELSELSDKYAQEEKDRIAQVKNTMGEIMEMDYGPGLFERDFSEVQARLSAEYTDIVRPQVAELMREDSILKAELTLYRQGFAHAEEEKLTAQQIFDEYPQYVKYVAVDLFWFVEGDVESEDYVPMSQYFIDISDKFDTVGRTMFKAVDGELRIHFVSQSQSLNMDEQNRRSSTELLNYIFANGVLLGEVVGYSDNERPDSFIISSGSSKKIDLFNLQSRYGKTFVYTGLVYDSNYHRIVHNTYAPVDNLDAKITCEVNGDYYLDYLVMDELYKHVKTKIDGSELSGRIGLLINTPRSKPLNEPGEPIDEENLRDGKVLNYAEEINVHYFYVIDNESSIDYDALIKLLNSDSTIYKQGGIETIVHFVVMEESKVDMALSLFDTSAKFYPNRMKLLPATSFRERVIRGKVGSEAMTYAEFFGERLEYVYLIGLEVNIDSQSELEKYLLEYK